jgi:hypothetical protein
MIVIGPNNFSNKSSYSLIFGTQNYVDGTKCTIIGNNNMVRGNGCIVIGNNYTVTEDHARIIDEDISADTIRLILERQQLLTEKDII